MTLADMVLIIVTDSLEGYMCGFGYFVFWSKEAKQIWSIYVICGHKSQPSCSETDPWATVGLDQLKLYLSIIENTHTHTYIYMVQIL